MGGYPAPAGWSSDGLALPGDSGWLVRIAAAQPAAAAVVCFPCAGGTTAPYRAWAAGAARRRLALLAVQPPGREARWGEAPSASLDAMAGAVAAALRPLHGQRLVLFGHSFGGVVACEVARRLVAEGRPPLLLAVAGTRPPAAPPLDPIGGLDDDAFLARVSAFGGLPQEVRAASGLIEAILPSLRGDFALLEAHRPAPGAPLPVALSVFGGLADRQAPPALLFGWSAETARSMRTRFLPGGHFFVLDAAGAVLDALVADVEALAGAGCSP